MNLIYSYYQVERRIKLCLVQEEILQLSLKQNCASEVLKGEKDINTIATENNIQPNLLRNWKQEFLDNASIVFDDKREENIKE